MFTRKKEQSTDSFWREYEEKTGEIVLARSLGKYISGWEEFDSRKWNSIWGLIIATSGGFRFHHFPQQSWIDAFTRSSGQDAPKEKTIFIPKDKIISARLIKETKWWKKIFNYSPPQLVIQFRDGTGNERQLLLEADFKADNLAAQLGANL